MVICAGGGKRGYVKYGCHAHKQSGMCGNKLMIRPVLDRRKPERLDFATRTGDNHNGADQAMALDLLANLDQGATFPVTPYESMEAGLTVMAIDRAMAEGVMIDCAPMWAAFDEARGAKALA